MATVAFFAALSLAACTGNSAAEPTATAVPAVAATTAPPAAATLAPTASPVATERPATPPPAPATPSLEQLNARRTGDPRIDVVIDALLGSDASALDRIVRTQSAVCHAQSLGIGDLEVCPPGVADGTEVEFFPTGVCEGFPLHQPPFVSFQTPDRTRLVAVIRVVPRAAPIPLWPDGEHLVIFEDATDSAVVTGVYIEDGEIVRTQQSCTTVEILLELGGDSPEDLLPSVD